MSGHSEEKPVDPDNLAKKLFLLTLAGVIVYSLAVVILVFLQN